MHNAAAVLVAITVFLGVLATTAVGLRLFCRYLQKMPVGLDDYLIIVALIFSWAVSIVCDYCASVTGVGEKNYQPTMADVVLALKVNYAAENIAIAGLGLVKVSLLIYYKRIFITKTFQWCANILIAVVSTFTLAILLCILFSKWPIKNQWNPMSVEYTLNADAVLLTYCSVNILLDLCTLFLPVTAIRSLNMSTHRKVILSVVFSLGSLCVFSSIMRLNYAVKFVHMVATPSSLFEPPFIYNMLWGIIEMPTFILANCLLTLGPWYRSKYGPAQWHVVSSIRSLLSSMRSTSGTRQSSSHQSGEKSSCGGSSNEDLAFKGPRHRSTVVGDNESRNSSRFNIDGAIVKTLTANVESETDSVTTRVPSEDEIEQERKLSDASMV